MAEETPACELEGRELDAAVAEEVMGNTVEWRDGEPYLPEHLTWGFTIGADGEADMEPERMTPKVPRHSEDIAAAWQVVNRLRHYSGHVGMISGTFCNSAICSVDVSFDNGDTRAYGVKAWRCTVTTFNEDDGRVTLARAEVECHNEDCGAPEAIARAALKAVRHDSPDPPVGPSGTDTE